MTTTKTAAPWLAWTFTIVGCCALLLRLGWVHYKWHIDELEYQEAIEEADRLDPGWRLADLEAARAAIPDEENSALQVLTVHQLMPKNWLPPPQASTECLEYTIDELSPRQSLDEKRSQELDDELQKVSEAVVAARRLADMPRGRYNLIWSKDAVFTLLPHLDAVEEVLRLLWLDAVHQTQHGDIEAALTSCRALLNTGRSIGDEPASASQVRRLRSQDYAMKSLERALAHGEPSHADLQALERLLQDESEQPLLLIAARGERAIWDQFLNVLKAGELDRAALWWRYLTRRSVELEDALDKKRAHATHGASLKYFNEYVENCKLRFEQQLHRQSRYSMPKLEECTTLFEGCCFGGSIEDLLTLGFGRRLALIRSAITALAVERYRLQNRCWPDRLEDLVPNYLNSIATDPIDGHALRYRHLADGVVIYSVGLDRIDDGGNIERVKFKEPGTDIGFQLWNPERRRQVSAK